MQGGSLRIFVSHTGVYKISACVTKLADKEINYGLDKIATYRKMNKNIEKLKKDIVSLLKKIKKEGKNIVGYSAPAKGVILLNHFAIGKYLDFIVDNSKAKQDLYVPGTDMKVFPVEKIMESKPDYVFIFAWNIADEIMQQLHEYKKQGGKFIIPIPVIKIV
jgi:ABC-type Fe3+-hydroxamate transport system substrate-binding protein